MNRSVEIYIKKNTLVYNGTATSTNTSPFLTVTSAGAGFTVNQYTGFYILMTSGVNINFRSFIDTNTNTVLTLQSAIPVDSGNTYSIYKTEFERLDLFKEEKISVTSQLQNSNNLAKLYTDYSQSFNVPASVNNNAIFSHWYESSVQDGYDHRVKYDGYIEVDTHRFKNGTFQLEKAQKKGGFIDSYQITFYGNLTQLKDVIKDDKLNSLNYTSLNHTYNSSQIINRIETVGTYDVRYPLIGNQKKYEYQTGGPSNDITLTTGAIKWNDLFPAITVKKIFDFIQNKYGITFTGSFLNDDRITKLFLYCKNALNMSEQTQRVKIDFTNLITSPFPQINLATDVLTTDWNFVPANAIGNIYNVVQIEITPAVGFTNIPYNIFCYKNGELLTTFSNLYGQRGFDVENLQRTQNPNRIKYEFYLSSEFAMNFIPRVVLASGYTTITAGVVSNTQIVKQANRTTVQSTTNNIDIVNYIPDIKIIDFLTGLIKMFNIMIIPKQNNTYELLPLELYYNQGKVLDITQYVYSDDLSIEKPKLFKSINFEYEQSNSILNVAYKSLYNLEYGNLIYTNKNITENETYSIKVPFENVLFEVPTAGKLFETATLIDKDLKPYIPKLMLMYLNGGVGTLTALDRIFMTTSAVGVTQAITNYQRFSNEYNPLPTDPTLSQLFSLNFNNEQSPWYNSLATNGLYLYAYSNYIQNLYSLNTRIIKVKALLPVSLIGSNVINSFGQTTGVKLNDRVIIRNKRYIINSFTTDITNGETSFELLTDFRGFNAQSTVGFRIANIQNFVVDKQATQVEIIIYVNDYDSFDIKAGTGFVTYTNTSNNTDDTALLLTIPVNLTLLDRLDSIIIEYKNKGVTENTEYLIIEQKGL